MIKIKKVQDFLNLTYQNGMISTINKLTRVTENTGHIITNGFIKNTFKTAIIKTNVSNHFLICIKKVQKCFGVLHLLCCSYLMFFYKLIFFQINSRLLGLQHCLKVLKIIWIRKLQTYICVTILFKFLEQKNMYTPLQVSYWQYHTLQIAVWFSGRSLHWTHNSSTSRPNQKQFWK